MLPNFVSANNSNLEGIILVPDTAQYLYEYEKNVLNKRGYVGTGVVGSHSLLLILCGCIGHRM